MAGGFDHLIERGQWLLQQRLSAAEGRCQELVREVSGRGAEPAHLKRHPERSQYPKRASIINTFQPTNNTEVNVTNMRLIF